MKKKTKSKLSSSYFSFAFLFSVLICLFGASGNGYFFYNSFYETLSKINEDPIATVSFKYNTAQRKFSDRTVWDRLKNNSALYNGDTIHTSVKAEATVTFNDGNRIVLSENTMLQIYLNENQTSSLMLEDGFAQVESSEESSGFEFVTNGNKIILDSGSSIVASDNTVQVVSGAASFATSEGIIKTITEGDSVNMEEKEESKALPKITVTSPIPNQTILYHSEQNTNINFAWKTDNFPENAQLILEVSENKDFKEILNSETLTSYENVAMSFSGGQYYWRIRSENLEENIAVQSKFKVYQSLPPSLISPVQDYTYSYRHRKPAVRFIWSDSSQASSYRLVVSKNPELNNPVINQRNNSTTSIISTLEEGTYYWQVTPYFNINKEGFAASSDIQSFVIDRRGELVAPSLYLPADNGIVDIQEGARNTSFSWKSENEAVSYNVMFYQSENARTPVLSYRTQDNYLNLKAVDVFKQGKWYWTVNMVDEEGNVSAASKLNTFFAMEGRPEIRLVEPIEGFKVAENLIQNQTFTWKKNLPEFMNTEIQFAKDPEFRQIVYSSEQNGYSFTGAKLTAGTYFWRLKSYSDVNDLVMTTNANELKIVGNLAAPQLKLPYERAIARETYPYKFTWNEVEDADSYKFSIYKGDQKLYDEVVYSNEIDVDMYNPQEFTDRTAYRWEVQARANAIPGVVSRRNGDISEGQFLLIKLRPIEILSPQKAAVYEGIDAAMNKIPITWQSVDSVSEAQVVVFERTKGGMEAVYKNPSDEEFAKGKKISEKTVMFNKVNLKNGGKYEVIVYSKTLDGLDISNSDAKYKGTFSVLPVEPLNAPANLVTVPKSFNLEYLRNLENPRSVTLNWQKISGANAYLVEIKNKDGKLILHEELADVDKYSVNWIDLINAQKTEKEKQELYAGNFVWTVEGIRKIDTDNDGVADTAIQPGNAATVDFQTDIPVSKSVQGKGTKKPYGK